MPDTKISNLTAVVTSALTDEFAVNQAGTSKKMTLSQVRDTSPRSATYFVAASNASSKVKAGADYVCDGTNDHVEINAAIAALPSTGGVIVLSEGEFMIASPILIQNDSITLQGAGLGYYDGANQGAGTRLEAVSGLTGQIILVQRAANDRPVYAAVLRDFGVDGKSLAGPLNGVLFRSSRGLMERVHVFQCTGVGITIRGYSSWATYDTQFYGCQSMWNDSHGWQMDTRGEDMQFIGCLGFNNLGSGFHVEAASEQFFACHAYDNRLYGWNFNSGGTRSVVNGCKIEGNYFGGILVTSTSQIKITGNQFKNNSRQTADTYSDLKFSGAGVDSLAITGNAFVYASAEPTSRVKYHIEGSGTGFSRSVIVGNVIGTEDGASCATANVLDNFATSSTFKNVIRHNSGWRTEDEGTITINAGASTGSATPNIDRSFTSENVQVTPRADYSPATRFWVTVSGGVITVNLNTTTTGAVTFAYKVERVY